MIGEWVEHNKYGKGQVLAKRNNGLYLEILFSDGSRHESRIEDIRFLQQSPMAQAQVQNSPVTGTTDPVRNEARAMIEAFRFGTVPREHISKFMFGRDQIIRELKHWIKTSGGGCKVVIGEYGSGKSHLTEFISYVALENKYAVARATLELSNAPGYKPKSVYRELVSSFNYKSNNSILGFRDYIKAYVNKSSNIQDSPDFIRYNLEKIRRLSQEGDSEELENLWDWLEGRESQLIRPPFPDFGTAANIYCHMVSWLAFTTSMSGLAGLLIILDECENKDQYMAQRQHEQFDCFLNGVRYSAACDAILKERLVAGRGHKSGLFYYQPRPVEYRYTENSPFKCVFAYTSEDHGIGNDETAMILEKMPEKVYRAIFNEVCRLYEQSYGDQFAKGDIEEMYNFVYKRIHMEDDPVRYFIKGAVEVLDLKSFDILSE